jgi:hypothetical protein
MRLLPRLMLGLLLAAPVLAQEATTPIAPAAPPAAVAPKAAPKAVPKPDPARGITPNSQRLVSIGAINKRTGQSRTFTLHPGEMFDFAGLRVAVRTCETTPPWEQRLTGAFLLIDERMVNAPMKRVFSGWMFAESPSLHPLEHPRYDVWVKSCTMRFPETGPGTVVAGRAAPAPSSAKKSPATPSAAPN